MLSIDAGEEAGKRLARARRQHRRSDKKGDLAKRAAPQSARFSDRRGSSQLVPCRQPRLTLYRYRIRVRQHVPRVVLALRNRRQQHRLYRIARIWSSGPSFYRRATQSGQHRTAWPRCLIQICEVGFAVKLALLWHVWLRRHRDRHADKHGQSQAPEMVKSGRMMCLMWFEMHSLLEVECVWGDMTGEDARGWG